MEEALHTKWDELQGIPCSNLVGHGPSQGGERRDIGAKCEPASWTEDQSSAVIEMLEKAEVECGAIGPKL